MKSLNLQPSPQLKKVCGEKNTTSFRKFYWFNIDFFKNQSMYMKKKSSFARFWCQLSIIMIKRLIVLE